MKCIFDLVHDRQTHLHPEIHAFNQPLHLYVVYLCIYNCVYTACTQSQTHINVYVRVYVKERRKCQEVSKNILHLQAQTSTCLI